MSRSFGFDLGTPIDRYYIERYLARHGGPGGDIAGRVIEIKDASYTRRFGAAGAVEHVDVLDIDRTNPVATLVGDLGVPGGFPTGVADCIVCTQTLLLVYDLHAAMANLYGLLAPGGVLLLTVPGISQICRDQADAAGDFWRFTTDSVRRLCEERFASDQVTVEAFGNALTAASFLYGLPVGMLKQSELDLHDPDYQVVVSARAVRAG